MHAGLRAQQAKSIFTLDLDGRALDARRVARGFVFNRGLEALALGVFEVLAQQHAGPVAGFGATGAGLDVQKAVQRIGLVAEHAAELQPFDDGGQLGSLALNRHQAGLVAVVLAHLEQFEVVRQLSFQFGDGDHHAVEGFFFFAQFLGAFGVVPDGGVF